MTAKSCPNHGSGALKTKVLKKDYKRVKANTWSKKKKSKQTVTIVENTTTSDSSLVESK